MSTPTVNAELTRILDLPYIGEITQEWVDHVSRQLCPPTAFRGKFKGLNAEQALALETYREFSVACVLSGVGTGKTTIAYGCAQQAAQEKGHRKILILTPNNVVGQFTTTGLREAREWLGFSEPVYVLAKKSAKTREAIASSGKPGVYVMSYPLLSQQNSEAVLSAIAPTCVIADECHRLRNAKTSAMAKRLLRHIKKIPVENRSLVFLSGTMTRRGLADYWHLVYYVLSLMSPLPTTHGEAQRWGALIDAQSSAFGNSEAMVGFRAGDMRQQLSPLITWARNTFPDEDLGKDDKTRLRRAFRLRFTKSQGIISSPSGTLPCPLVIENVPPARNPNPQLVDYIERVEQLGETPSGDQIEFALHKYKWLLELSAGFYHDLRWPEIAKIVESRHVSEAEAEDLLARSQHHHKLLQVYHKSLRGFLEDRTEPGCDTPFSVGVYFHREEGPGQLPENLYAEWRAAKDAEFDGIITRESHPILVDVHKLEALSSAVRLAMHEEGRGGLVWVYHNAMREWAVQQLQADGLQVFNCPSGSKQAVKELQEDQARKHPEAWYVLSYNGWREGLNLQWGSNAIYLQWPRGEDVIEQSIGRQHRQGQMADECNVYTLLGTPDRKDPDSLAYTFDRTLFAAGLVDSLYVQQTQGQPRRLMAAAYTEPPHMYPLAMLAERFPNMPALTRQQQEELFARFAGGR